MSRLRAYQWLRSRIRADRARCGQVVIMFALLCSALIGMLGLALDGGNALYARRSVQAAADAAALGGAWKVSKATPESVDPAIQGEVDYLVAGNRFGPANPEVASCAFIDNERRILADPCSGSIPTDATGVRIETRASVPTFFIRILPGGPMTVEVTAAAEARVRRPGGLVSNAPFIACGASGWDVTSDPGTRNGGEVRPILDADNRIRADAVNKIYRIWDSNLEGTSDCREGSQFKGLSAQHPDDIDNVAGEDIRFENGTRVGQTLTAVNGPGGCESGVAATSVDDCVLILPIGSQDAGGAGNDGWIKIVTYGVYLMSPAPGINNAYNGKLLGAYTISAADGGTWQQGDTLKTIRLTD